MGLGAILAIAWIIEIRSRFLQQTTTEAVSVLTISSVPSHSSPTLWA